MGVCTSFDRLVCMRSVLATSLPLRYPFSSPTHAGVTREKGGKWRARICLRGGCYNLGSFSFPEEVIDPCVVPMSVVDMHIFNFVRGLTSLPLSRR